MLEGQLRRAKVLGMYMYLYMYLIAINKEKVITI